MKAFKNPLLAEKYCPIEKSIHRHYRKEVKRAVAHLKRLFKCQAEELDRLNYIHFTELVLAAGRVQRAKLKAQ